MRVPLSQYPGMNSLVLDWLAGDERFLRRGGVASEGRRKRPIDPALVEALDHSNQQWGIFARPALEAWAAGTTQTIVAGQQVGFAGGPLYTLAKIVTLVRMKRDLERQGKQATLFFWLATEDHDYDEVATLCVPTASITPGSPANRELDLVCMRAVRTADAHATVGSLPLPGHLVDQLLSLYHLPRPSWLREGITFRDSFAELVASLFPDDLILVDALLPELRRAGAPLFASIRENDARIQEALTNRTAELERAGYKGQVIARDGSGYTLLFALDGDGRRCPGIEAADPKQTSTSALTRPLLQDFVLQPDVFVGGPAEVAYYAQISPLHEMLGVELPRVALRGHALVAPERLLEVMKRYEIEPHEVFGSADEILVRREPAAVARIEKIVEEGRMELMRRVEQIGELALPADRSLAGSIGRSIEHLEYHFRKLGERAVRGVVRRDRDRYRAVRRVVATLFPDRHVQERIVGWYPWWCTYGEVLLQRLVDEIEPDSDHFRIVGV